MITGRDGKPDPDAHFSGLADRPRTCGARCPDVGLAAGVGVPGQRDPVIAGDYQAQPDQAQMTAFLPGLARCAIGALPMRVSMKVARLVMSSATEEQCSPNMLTPERDAAADLGQLLRGHGVHRVPEPQVVVHAGRDLGEPGCRRLGPSFGEGPLGARVGQPVQRRQHQVGAYGCARIRPPRPGHLRLVSLVPDRAHHAHLGLGRGLRSPEQGSALHPGPGATGALRSDGSGRRCCFRSRWDHLPGRPGVAALVAGLAPPGLPCLGDARAPPAAEGGRGRHVHGRAGDVTIRPGRMVWSITTWCAIGLLGRSG